jgi:hypothetical protein
MFVPEDAAIHGNRNHHLRLLHQEPLLRHPQEELLVMMAVLILLRHPVTKMLGSMKDSAPVGEAEGAADGPPEQETLDQLLVANNIHLPLRKHRHHLDKIPRLPRDNQVRVVLNRHLPHRQNHGRHQSPHIDDLSQRLKHKRTRRGFENCKLTMPLIN